MKNDENYKKDLLESITKKIKDREIDWQKGDYIYYCTAEANGAFNAGLEAALYIVRKELLEG